MKDDIKNLSVVELLDRVDLSHYDKTEIIRLRAEVERAEFVAACITGFVNKVKALFVSKKDELSVAGARHA
ncbi:hypothetical protein WH50_16975 [Pokkaliibacter plantistimulans]|uniref:Uncharacterized protein n=2 Tax=Pseudomonadota TaxID=1224 RepID=A0ABX5LWW4_9GAMM|nr:MULTISPECIES: hypothetical protein [Pokkaliibacter]MDH2435649.1 hypothetical protein [Pokkaliibacter sp. MBI-7]PPC79355.1 hypothetical protein C4K68_00085 [Pokkaliibacter plantistimulans]PXF30125.1 hypothetical protein WH50_16975 [Pokkaliibacter plantistimulans]